MLKKNKKFTLLLSGLSGALLVSSAAGVALSSCSTTSSSSSDVQYSYVIDWNNEDAVKRLIIDDNGLVYSDSAMTTIIAVSPKVKLTTVKIPSRVKSIIGYSKVMYKDSSGNLTDSAPSSGTYTKVYQSYGAFQGMESLETVVLESGSQLQSIGAYAFNGCTTLKNISNLSSSLKYIGISAFNGCTNLEAIDLSNVVKVDDYAFIGCTSLSTINLANVLSIGNYSFQNCSNLTALGSLQKVSSIGQYAFYGATKSGSNIELKFSNLKVMSLSAFHSTKGISTVDFSNNTLLTTIYDNAFMYSSVTSVNFDGCSSLSSINERAFESCTNLTSVTLPSDDVTNLVSIGYNAFINCSSLSTVGAKGTAAKSFVATKKLSNTGANFLANTLIETLDLSKFIPNNSIANPFGSAASLAYIPNLSSVTLPSNLALLNAGLFYGSGLNSTTGFSLKLPNTVTSLVYSASISIANPNNSNTTTQEAITNVTPFTNSGLASIDMSDITSYQTTSGSTTVIPSYLFNGLTKLTSVILKTDTTGISNHAFQSTTALTSITYPSSSNEATAADTTTGFTASSTLTSIGTGAFYSAFSENADITVDLSAMTSLTTAPVAFNGSKVTTLKLPSSITTINADSFDNMTKLASVNFADLTNLTTIYKGNFNNTKLTSIDLSTTKFATITGNGNLFTGLPTTCEVSLPNTIGSFSGVFIGTDNNPVSFNYPNGLSLSYSSSFVSVSSGVLKFASTTQEQLSNIKNINLSSNSSIYSLGPSTFFGNAKLSSVTLAAKGISSYNIFTAATGITANTVNTNQATSQYVTASVPFGSNEAFTSLNYTGFTSGTGTTGSDNQATLFNTTTTTTWSEVAKIINSLSYVASATSEDTAKASPANMSAWTTAVGASKPMNTDEAPTFTENSKVVFSNSYTSASDTAAATITINAADTTATFIHNGITWTYTNNGSSITLTGKANMYKAANSSNSYLAFFNQTTYSTTGSTTTTYYVPSSTSVNVTLTIATASSSATK